MSGQLRQTSGTSRRPGRLMSGQGDVFTLADEIQKLKLDLEHTSGGRAAKTLAKTDGLRVTLVLLEQGAMLNPESTAGGASVHVLHGRLHIQLAGDEWDVGPGEMMVLDQNLKQPLSAVEQSAFLVTIAWPAGAGASERAGWS
jgi:quercetin dioxygenase-like cupin family protein